MTKNLPFGERFGALGVQCSRRFEGQEDQPGSAVYLQARMYLPGYGRFSQPDPAHARFEENPESWNLYAYALNNPLLFQDANGMAPTRRPGERKRAKGQWVWMDETHGWAKWVPAGKDPNDDDPDPDGEDDYPDIVSSRRSHYVEPYSGFFESLWSSLSSVVGFYNPANWNSEGMLRLYREGALGQAEALTRANGDWLDRNAYRLTAGSLAVSAASVAAAGGLMAAEAAGITDLGSAKMGLQGGEVTFTRMTTGSKDLRINPLGDWGNANWESQLPHWHYRPGPGVPGHGIGRHLPWDWFF